FQVPNCMVDDQVTYMYSHYDRAIIGGIKPVAQTLTLPNPTELKADYFLERREVGFINVGGAGTIEADGTSYTLDKLGCVYLGKGTQKVTFKSTDPKVPALFFMMSVPAHQSYPNAMLSKEEASPMALGDPATSNKRTIYKYIHLEGIRSCQLVMGLTALEPGSVWNSVPPHTHTRRMEAYFYFDLPANQRVFHYMGQPQETRHLVMNNYEAVISPPWSVHFGCGSANYAFIWAMAGENQVFSDMDGLTIADIK
ncbi:MAG TPA: 5-dehydro-4-deoxy-D-glucuronate isomerase, partial [Cytophagales bacterium]|nr:5-dehydro-4-deoxy-D-glucuronate isomerase [Cytophagales bacterium]